MPQQSKKPAVAAIGAAFAGSMMLAGAASAGSNPFALTELDGGYLQVAGEGKCGAGKCGGTMDKSAEGKCGAGKCGAGQCGSAMQKSAEGKCGAGKCGAGQCGSAMQKSAEGKCGAGKCGGNNK